MTIKFIEHIEGYFSSKKAIASDFFTLIKLEAKLAGLSLYPLVVNGFILLTLLMSFWFMVLTASGYLLTLWVGNFLMALSILLAANFILVLGIMQRIHSCFKQLSFEKTRACLSSDQLQDKSNDLTEKATPSH